PATATRRVAETLPAALLARRRRPIGSLQLSRAGAVAIYVGLTRRSARSGARRRTETAPTAAFVARPGTPAAIDLRGALLCRGSAPVELGARNRIRLLMRKDPRVGVAARDRGSLTVAKP